jgi:hypothetical protein
MLIKIFFLGEHWIMFQLLCVFLRQNQLTLIQSLT